MQLKHGDELSGEAIYLSQVRVLDSLFKLCCWGLSVDQSKVTRIRNSTWIITRSRRKGKRKTSSKPWLSKSLSQDKVYSSDSIQAPTLNRVRESSSDSDAWTSSGSDSEYKKDKCKAQWIDWLKTPRRPLSLKVLKEILPILKIGSTGLPWETLITHDHCWFQYHTDIFS